MSIYSSFKAANIRNVSELSQDISKNLLHHVDGKGIVAATDIKILLAEEKILDSALHRNLNRSFDAFKKLGANEKLGELEMRRQFVNGITSELSEAVRSDPQRMTSVTRSMRAMLETPPGPNKAVSDFMGDLLRTKGKNNKTAADFTTIQAELEKSGLLYRGNVSDLGRKEFSTLSDIATAAKKGELITPEELTRLKGGNPKQNILAIQNANTGVNNPWDVFGRVSKIVSAVPSTVSNFFVTPAKWDGLKSTSFALRAGAVSLAALATGYSGTQLAGGDARGLSTGGAMFINTVLKPYDWLSSTELETFSGNKDTTPISDQTYLTLTSGKGLLNPRFVEYTKDLTGVNLAGKEFQALTKLESSKVLLQAAMDLQANDGRSFKEQTLEKGSPEVNAKGYNPQTFYAYKYAFASNLGLHGGDKAESFTVIADQLKKRYEDAALNALMNTDLKNEDAKKDRDSVLKKFLGTETLPTDANLNRALLVRFSNDQAAGGGAEIPLIRAAVSKFLVKNGVNAPIDEKTGTITIPAAQQALREYSDIAKQTATTEKDKTLAQLGKSGVDVFKEIGAASAGGAAPQSAQTASVACPVKIPSEAKLASILDNASTLTDVPIKDLQKAFKAAIKDNCVTKDLVESELSKVTPQARQAAGWIMKGLGEGPN